MNNFLEPLSRHVTYLAICFCQLDQYVCVITAAGCPSIMVAVAHVAHVNEGSIASLHCAMHHMLGWYLQDLRQALLVLPDCQPLRQILRADHFAYNDG